MRLLGFDFNLQLSGYDFIEFSKFQMEKQESQR